jgi:hypothetical protein
MLHVMSWPLRGLSVSLLALVCGACDEGEVAVSKKACSQLCAKLEVCNDGTDVPGCEQRCVSETARSDEYFRVRARCVEQLACNHLVGELGTSGESLCSGECQVEDCVDDALAAKGHTQEHEDLCFRASNKLAACDATVEPTTLTVTCMDVAPSVSADYLEETSRCIDEACERIEPCLSDAADRYDTSLRLF